MSVQYNSIADDELLSLLKDGDRDAFTQIYRNYWQEIYQAAYKRLRDKEQCQDIVQNVFASLWDRRDEVDIKKLAAWLHTSVKFQVIKYVSRKPQNSEFLEAFENIITSPIHTDDALLEKEVVRLVQLYVDSLPRKRKTIFLLHYLEDASTSEIAEKLDISQKTIQNQLNTAKHALQARLAHLFAIIVIASFLANK